LVNIIEIRMFMCSAWSYNKVVFTLYSGTANFFFEDLCLMYHDLTQKENMILNTQAVAQRASEVEERK